MSSSLAISANSNSLSDLGVEDATEGFPLIVYLLHHEELAVALAAFGILALGYDGARTAVCSPVSSGSSFPIFCMVSPAAR